MIAYERQGPSGEAPIVLVHAGIADRRMWDPIWATLTAVRDVVRYDLSGFGASDLRPDGPVDHVADLTGLLDDLGIEGCHLVAASFGSGVAVETALTHPGRVRSLLLGPPGGSLLAEFTPALQAFVDLEDAALERGDVDAAVEVNVDTWVVGAGRTLAEIDPAAVDAVRVMQRRAFEIDARWGETGAVELDPPAVERLPELTLPILVLVGGHDLDTTHLAAALVAAQCPQVRRVDWPHVAHLPSMERPADFTALVLEWVEHQ